MCKDLREYLKDVFENDVKKDFGINGDCTNFEAAYQDSNFQAWDNCFNMFKAMREKRRISAEDMDCLCLHLTAYLASWGMYRGSSFLTNHDYTIHRKAIHCIMQKKYDDLLEIKIENHADKTDKIISLYNDIKNSYKGKGTPTDTLITKIMLSVLACVPAHDTYVKAALKDLDLQQSFPAKEEKLKEFADKIIELEILKNPTSNCLKDIGHPDMKIIDFCLFFYGQYLLNGGNE